MNKVKNENSTQAAMRGGQVHTKWCNQNIPQYHPEFVSYPFAQNFAFYLWAQRETILQYHNDNQNFYLGNFYKKICEVPIKSDPFLLHEPSTQETKPFFPSNAPTPPHFGLMPFF
jgi:hypothetical protein